MRNQHCKKMKIKIKQKSIFRNLMFENSSIKVKLIAVYIVLTIIPIFIILIVSNRTYSSNC